MTSDRGPEPVREEGPPDQPDSFFAHSLRRIEVWTVVLAVLGAIGVSVQFGWRPGVGLLLGAVLGGVNFYLFRRIARGIGSEAGAGRGRAGSAVAFGLRFVAIGVSIFVIMKILGIGPVPVLSGLLLPAGAVLIESIYLLIASLTNRQNLI